MKGKTRANVQIAAEDTGIGKGSWAAVLLKRLFALHTCPSLVIEEEMEGPPGEQSRESRKVKLPVMAVFYFL